MEGPARSRSSDTANSCSAPVPLDPPPSRIPGRSPSCPVPLTSRGAPRMVPVFGGERFLRLSRASAQGVSASNFKIFSLSTCCPQFSRSYPPVGLDPPQEIHRGAAVCAISCPAGNAPKPAAGPGWVRAGGGRGHPGQGRRLMEAGVGGYRELGSAATEAGTGGWRRPEPAGGGRGRWLAEAGVAVGEPD